MPVTRLVNTALDGVSRAMAATAAAIATFAGSDLICYRAGEPASLVAAQNAAWEPILAFFRAAHGARFICAEGVVFVDQPPDPWLRSKNAWRARRKSPTARCVSPRFT